MSCIVAILNRLENEIFSQARMAKSYEEKEAARRLREWKKKGFSNLYIYLFVIIEINFLSNTNILLMYWKAYGSMSYLMLVVQLLTTNRKLEDTRHVWLMLVKNKDT